MFEKSRVFRFPCFDSFCRLLRQRLLLNVFLYNFPREIGASPAKIDLLARVRLLTAVGIKSRCQKNKNSSNSCSYDSLDINDLGYLYRLQIHRIATTPSFSMVRDHENWPLLYPPSTWERGQGFDNYFQFSEVTTFWAETVGEVFFCKIISDSIWNCSIFKGFSQ